MSLADPALFRIIQHTPLRTSRYVLLVAQVPVEDQLDVVVVGGHGGQPTPVLTLFGHVPHFKRLFEQLVAAKAFHGAGPGCFLLLALHLDDMGLFDVGVFGTDPTPDQVLEVLRDARVVRRVQGKYRLGPCQGPTQLIENEFSELSRLDV